MSYNPEYYGAPETQGTEKSLLEGEINVVENIKNEQKNKDALIKADEDTYPAMTVSPVRELFPGEINVVENINNYETNKDSLITHDDEDVQRTEMIQKIQELESKLASTSGN